MNEEAARQAAPPVCQQSADLERDNPQQFKNDEDDGNNDQNMDPAACFREAWANASTQKAEQPQDDQNYDDSPQHEISPFE